MLDNVRDIRSFATKERSDWECNGARVKQWRKP